MSQAESQSGINLPLRLPQAVKVPAVLIIYEDAAGDLRSSLRWYPTQGQPMGECLDLLSRALMAALQKHSVERIEEGLRLVEGLRDVVKQDVKES